MAAFCGQGVSVLRYRDDGTLDPSFGTAGRVQLATPSFLAGFAYLRQSSTALIIGSSAVPEQERTFTRMRTFLGGDLDLTYGTRGTAHVPFGAGILQATRMYGDGRVLASKRDLVKTSLLRVDANGAVDTTFGTNGWADLPLLDVRRVEVAADGKILVAGWTATSNAVARLLADGRVDRSFGLSGVATFANAAEIGAVQSFGGRVRVALRVPGGVRVTQLWE